MTCRDASAELFAFHFGETVDERAALEGHLLGCSACLRSFLDLKREAETAEEVRPASDFARARLRESIATELGKPPPPRWAAWERPFAGVVAAVALTAALVLVHVVRTAPGAMPLSLRASAGRSAPR